MAKKRVKVDLKSAGAEPAAGDVNISYKGARIAGLSESSTAVLETEATIVENDIEVEYTKPQTGIPIGNTVNITNNTTNSVPVSPTLETLGVNNAGSTANEFVCNANSTITFYVINSFNRPNYRIGLAIDSVTDQYVITTGSTNWEYDSREGVYGWGTTDTNPINNQIYNVVINNKEN